MLLTVIATGYAYVLALFVAVTAHLASVLVLFAPGPSACLIPLSRVLVITVFGVILAHILATLAHIVTQFGLITMQFGLVAANFLLVVADFHTLAAHGGDIALRFGAGIVGAVPGQFPVVAAQFLRSC